MHVAPMQISFALISVSNKAGLLPFAQYLHSKHIKIIATDSTARYLAEHDIASIKVADLTAFPAIMQGRVKTLHPIIHGGILGKRDVHYDDAVAHNIQWIDLVVCNFYPFIDVVNRKATERADSAGDLDEIIENIDVGGPTMVRGAAKNFSWVTTITDPKDYQVFIAEYDKHNSISFALRKTLAVKAFAYTAKYDADIYNCLEQEAFPENLILTYKKNTRLRYGENPSQQASVYIEDSYQSNNINLVTVDKLHGKVMSYNNFVDVEVAVNCLAELGPDPACIIIKHAIPCGAAISDNIDTAFMNAYMADKKSAFGGVIAINKICSSYIASQLNADFVEVMIAPDYEPEALVILQYKTNLRILKEPLLDINNNNRKLHATPRNSLAFRKIHGGILLQTSDASKVIASKIAIVTEVKPNPMAIADMMFGWNVAKYVKSNAIVIAKNQTTLGIGAGQVSRVDAVNLAITKALAYAYDLTGASLASDGFFPFADSIELLQKYGVKHIIQPGGSIRDSEVILACDKYQISMGFTGIRCFYH